MYVYEVFMPHKYLMIANKQHNISFKLEQGPFVVLKKALINGYVC